MKQHKPLLHFHSSVLQQAQFLLSTATANLDFYWYFTFTKALWAAECGFPEEGSWHSHTSSGNSIHTGRRKIESNNELPPVPNPQTPLCATFSPIQTPKLALGLQFAFQTTLPHSFAVCPVLLEPSARSSPSSSLCWFIWQLHSLVYSKKSLFQSCWDRRSLTG